MASNLIAIDGALLEGGGQILRNSAALSCLLGQPITVYNIRAGRKSPGLRPQHLTGLQLISQLCGGKVEGDRVGSTEITFYPGRIQSGTYMADTKTAGSICLLIQAALPCQFYANGHTELHLRGGTNAEMAPQVDYLTWIFQPMTERFGLKFNCDIVRRGYFPKGGGEVKVQAEPLKYIKAVDLVERGDIVKITGRSFVAGVLPHKVANLQARSAQDALKEYYPDVPIQIDALKEPDHKSFGNGTGIILMAETSTGCRLAGSALGKKGVPAEKVGQMAAEELMNNLQHGGCVDVHLQDQLIILMALAKGKSRLCCGPITLHTETAIHVAQTLTQAKFKISEMDGNKIMIECDGIGLENNNFP